MNLRTLSFAAVLLLPVGAALAQEQGALGVQISAAQISARAGSRNIFAIEDIRRRIQSSINCLVGPKDPDFRADAPNPCATTGDGVIPGTSDAARKGKYREVVGDLKAILAMDDRKVAMEAALVAADKIVAISEGN
jgi:hypothetical protein